MKTILLVAALLVLSACGKNEETTNLSYQYKINGCDTGLQSFSSLADLCAGLQSSSRNNGCAISLREQRFAQDCTGTFTPTP